MNKKKFQSLISSSQVPSESEMNQLEELQKNYPFSQVIHAVTARTHLKKKSAQSQSKLGRAAIYSTNRKVLKRFIELEPDQPPVEKLVPKVKATKKEVAQKTVIEKPKITEEKKSTTKSSLAKVTKKVQSKTEKQVKPVNTEPKPEPQKEIKQKKTVPKILKSDSPVTSEKAASDTKTSTPRKESQVSELLPQSTNDGEMDILRAEVMQNLKDLEEKKKGFEKSDKPESKKPKKKVVKKAPKTQTHENPLIEQINSLEEREVGDKQKKQNKLIEEFVYREPEKKAPKSNTEQDVTDLARESVNFNEDLISENLAIIFAKQGKKDKAIEIYKKLIWKYPQKKTYFATQIKDLENN